MSTGSHESFQINITLNFIPTLKTNPRKLDLADPTVFNANIWESNDSKSKLKDRRLNLTNAKPLSVSRGPWSLVVMLKG